MRLSPLAVAQLCVVLFVLNTLFVLPHPKESNPADSSLVVVVATNHLKLLDHQTHLPKVSPTCLLCACSTALLKSTVSNLRVGELADEVKQNAGTITFTVNCLLKE